MFGFYDKKKLLASSLDRYPVHIEKQPHSSWRISSDLKVIWNREKLGKKRFSHSLFPSIYPLISFYVSS